MFLLISFVIANNYCVEITDGRCERICNISTFDKIFNHIPTNDELNTDNDVKHNIYISDIVDYSDSEHKFIFCNPSLYLTYSDPINKITVKDHVYINSEKILKDAPILYHIRNDFTIEIDTETDVKSNLFDIKLQSYDYYYLTTRFYTEVFPENLISIDTSSASIRISEKTDNIKKLFENDNKLFDGIQYYCLSDKENKCSDFKKLNNYNSIIDINSTYEIRDRSIYLIIDTSIPELIENNFQYVHIHACPGSDVTFYSDYQQYSINTNNRSVLMHSNSVEMDDFIYEGEGSFTLATNSNISLLSTTDKTSYSFSIKTKDPLKYKISHIFSIKENSKIELENKIHIPEYSLFIGPKCLSGLFEKDRFLTDEEFTNYIATIDDLKEYDFDFVTYYFGSGEYEIPTTWKRPSKFVGIDHDNTNFIFDDVHSYDGYSIDNFIELDYHDKITIKPSNYLYLHTFDALINDTSYEKFTIKVEKNFILDGRRRLSGYYYDEMAKDQCTIIGNGKIHFISSTFMEDIRKLCQYDENIEFIYNGTKPHYNICVGQSDLEKCKSEINDIESLTESEWIWLRNLNALDKIDYKRSVYVTDQQYYNESYYYNLILTSKSVLIVPFYISNYYGSFYTYYDSIQRNIEAQSKSAQVIVFFTHFSYSDYMAVFDLRYFTILEKYDTIFNFYYEKCKLYINYIKRFQSNSIELRGKSVIYIREPYQYDTHIFKTPQSVVFAINYDLNYNQICYSDKPEEEWSLYDYILCKNQEEFYQYSNGVHTFIYKDISLLFSSRTISCNNFYFSRNATITCELPNNSKLFVSSSTHTIYTGGRNIYFNNIGEQMKFIYDINDTVYLDIVNHYSNSMEFISSNSHIEIIPSYSTKTNSIGNYISTPDSISLLSPAPSYISHLFVTKQVSYSQKWSYLYLSDEGNSLYGQTSTISSIPFHDIEKDTDLLDNIVIAIGKNDILTIPSNWDNIHNIFILQEGNDLYIEEQSNITFRRNFMLLNDKFQFIIGNLSVFVSENFTINIDLDNSNSVVDFFYNVKLNCYRNPYNELYFGFISYYWVANDYINIYGYNNTLTMHYKNHNQKNNLGYYIDTYDFNSVNNYYHYKYIRYCNYYSYDENTFVTYDLSGLYEAIKEMPYLPVLLERDVYIINSITNHLKLYAKNPRIQIELKEFPESMTIFENKTIRFMYSDSTIIDIMNTSIINVVIIDSIRLDIQSSTDSIIIFELESDVFVSTEKEITSNVNISVINNSYHLYTEELDKFGNIFGDSLESYIRICAYDDNTNDLCSFTRREKIEDIFKEPFDYNEVEVALSSHPVEINLPPVTKQVQVNIVSKAKTVLSLGTIYSLYISKDSIDINEHWTFKGEINKLTLKLNNLSVLSVVDFINISLSRKPIIILELTNTQTFIDLRNFDKEIPNSIKLIKYGEDSNEITVFGPKETFENFHNSLKRYFDILIVFNGTQKYLCVCNEEEECERCQENVEGVFITKDKITSDPGVNTKIRIFSNIGVSSNIFNNEHDVFIDNKYSLILKDVDAVYQNIEEGIKIDNLYFANGSNLVLQPDDISLNISMKKNIRGPDFTIDFEKFIRLNVVNFNEKNVSASRLYVNGEGELNIVDYPFDGIRAGPKVKIIKGVYLVCNSFCSYETMYGYKRLGHSHEFGPDFDPYSKIIVFLHTFTNNLDANLASLRGQKILFDRDPLNPLNLLGEPAKLRITSTEVMCSSNETTELTSSLGGASLDNVDSDQFIVGFDGNLTIKQEGDVISNPNSITIQPMADDVTIFIDDSVDINKQKFKVETEKDKTVSLKVVSNKNIENDEVLKNLFEIDKEKVTLVVGDQQPAKKKKGFPTGAIIGIVVGAVVVVSAIAMVIVIVTKKKKLIDKGMSPEPSDVCDDSTF